MTHFTVMVVGETDSISEVPDALVDLLAPFNEQGEEFFTHEPMTLTDEKVADAQSVADERKVPLDELLEEWYNGIVKNAEGKYTYVDEGNPNGYWDWWVVGGRWSGLLERYILPGSDPEKYGKGDSGAFKNETGIDYAFVEVLDMKKMIDDGFHTAAIVKNGEWIQPATMGWWGIDHSRTEAEDDWNRLYCERLFKDTKPGFFVAVVDCHV